MTDDSGVDGAENQKVEDEVNRCFRCHSQHAVGGHRHDLDGVLEIETAEARPSGKQRPGEVVEQRKEQQPEQ